MHDELWGLAARELAGRLRRREVSAREALEAHLGVIERRNRRLNAVVSLDVEGARRVVS